MSKLTNSRPRARGRKSSNCRKNCGAKDDSKKETIAAPPKTLEEVNKRVTMMGGIAILPGMGIPSKVALRPVSSREGLNGVTSAGIAADTSDITSTLAALKLKRNTSTEIPSRTDTTPSELPFTRVKLKKTSQEDLPEASLKKTSRERENPQESSLKNQGSATALNDGTTMHTDFSSRLKKVSHEKLDTAGSNRNSSGSTSELAVKLKKVSTEDVSSKAPKAFELPVKLKKVSKEDLTEDKPTTTPRPLELPVKLKRVSGERVNESLEHAAPKTPTSANQVLKPESPSVTIAPLRAQSPIKTTSKPASPIRDLSKGTLSDNSQQPEFLSLRTKLRSAGVKLDLAKDEVDKDENASVLSPTSPQKPTSAIPLTTPVSPNKFSQMAKPPTKMAAPVKVVTSNVNEFLSKRGQLKTVSSNGSQKSLSTETVR